MSADPTSLRPVAARYHVPGLASAFGLLAGPAAWFIQLCAGYALSSWPCFPKDHRDLVPLQGYGWSGTALAVISLCALLICIAALVVSRNIYQRTTAEIQGDRHHPPGSDVGRTHFLALWGMAAGGAFAVATAFTAAEFFLLPRCAG